MAVILPPPIVAAFKALATTAMAKLQEQRLRDAREILARRIARGRPWLISDDDTAAAIWTFLRAAQEGVAKRNLELMADALVSSADQGAFHPDEFRRQSAMLADLSLEEIVILATLIRCRRAEGEGGEEEGHRKSKEWEEISKRLIARHDLFRDGHDVTAHTAGLLRTGLIIPWSGLSAYTGFSSTARLDALARLVDFEGAERRSHVTEPPN